LISKGHFVIQSYCGDGGVESSSEKSLKTILQAYLPLISDIK